MEPYPLHDVRMITQKKGVSMAKVQGTFESIVGSYFDDFVSPIHSVTGVTDDEMPVLRGQYIQEVASDEEIIRMIENIYGVTII